MNRRRRSLVLLATSLLPAVLAAQIAATPPPSSLSAAATIAPTKTTPTPTPPSHTFHDPNYKVSFDYPANWTFARKDGEISTFHLDARSAPHNTRLRAVAAIPENPYPESTFSGAYVYLSVTPHSSDAVCTRQAAITSSKPSASKLAAPPHARPGASAAASREAEPRPTKSQIAGIAFAHGHDQQKHICITDRDEVYTTLHKGACYRFDLAINNFCGGEVSGVKDISPQELDDVRHRMESILATVRFDPK